MKLALLVVALIAACGTTTKPAGATCGVSSECDTGLSCEGLGQFSGSDCTVVGRVCTKTCSVNGDCADLGSSFMCFASCGSAMVCGATAP